MPGLQSRNSRFRDKVLIPLKMDRDKLFIAKAFFKARIDQIGDWSVGDIRRCCRLRQDGTFEQNGSMVGAFILWVCALDYLGGLLTNDKRGYKKRIRGFLRYLNRARKDNNKPRRYDDKKLIVFRNELVHSYSPNYTLVSAGDRTLHLRKRNKRMYLVLEEVIEDMEEAFKFFKNDLLSSNKMMLMAFDYYKTYPPLGPIE